jgi:hypothetical protein
MQLPAPVTTRRVAVIIFPFGFYILDGKMPVYVGNDLEAQNTVSAWKAINAEQIRLAFDKVGPVQISTVFEGWDHGASYAHMDQAPLLFETTVLNDPNDPHQRRRYSGYDAALAGHAELVELARSKLR